MGVVEAGGVGDIGGGVAGAEWFICCCFLFKSLSNELVAFPLAAFLWLISCSKFATFLGDSSARDFRLVVVFSGEDLTVGDGGLDLEPRVALLEDCSDWTCFDTSSKDS